MGVNVAELVYEQARLRPASPAIITHEQVVTYGQLSVAVGIVARHLRQQGVMPGQVVGLSMGQNPLHVIAILALAQVGAVSLPLHLAVPAERRALAARRFGATCVVSGRDDMALPGLPFISLAGLSFDGSSAAVDAVMHPVSANTPFRIVISSGTSGDPKGMVITHGLAINRTRRHEPGLDPRSRVIPMDLSFVIGSSPAIRSLSMGACLVFPRSMSSEHLLAAIVSHGVTHLLLSPAQAHGMADLFAADGIHCPSLVGMCVVGGPLSATQLAAVQETLTVNVLAGYGSSESGMVTLATPDLLARKPASVGRVNTWAHVEVVDADDHTLPAGETGLLRIRSEDQVSGYYRNEPLNRKHFRDGWFYPGDLGRFDEEGLLYIEGRVDDQLNVGGLKINPEDIDAALTAHPNVAEAGAFVLVREEGAELLAVALVLRNGNNLDDIRNHAGAQLGPLEPAAYFVVPTLPRTITGKLRRAELSAQFASHDHLS